MLLVVVVTGGLAVVEGSLSLVLGKASAPSEGPIQKMDEALAREKTDAALRAWGDAYRAAVAGGRWEDLVEAGDAYRRIGEVAALRERFDARAREIYLSALFRARQQDSVEGVLRVAEALVTLGDREGAEQSLRIAQVLAALDPEAKADVREFTARFADELVPRGSAGSSGDFLSAPGGSCKAGG